MNHFARRTAAGGAAVLAAAGLLLAAGCSDEDQDKAKDTVGSVTSAMGGAGSTTTTGMGGMTTTPDADESGTGTATPTTSATAAGESTTISTPNGDITVSGEVYKKYVAAGGATSPLGAPEEAQEAGPNGGQYQDFEGGTIYWSSDSGAHIVWGDIRETWEDEGGANGPLGYPTSDETNTANGGKQSEFTGGTIVWVNGETTVTKK
ncbi:LGFP repeat-containing protein [Nocardia asteroides]|nr:esterase [Nocardia asteroides]TLF69993.1 esterase [Nocardia asteroides NBRC 15531]UGT49513.1 esterase [Nocardia asteroides]SFL93046.1 LGFP repeat-containing protein [Nocardia asteroides]VEG37876.1 LGFP repeat [Nocardia asteroides]